VCVKIPVGWDAVIEWVSLVLDGVVAIYDFVHHVVHVNYCFIWSQGGVSFCWLACDFVLLERVYLEVWAMGVVVVRAFFVGFVVVEGGPLFHGFMGAIHLLGLLGEANVADVAGEGRVMDDLVQVRCVLQLKLSSYRGWVI